MVRCFVRLQDDGRVATFGFGTDRPTIGTLKSVLKESGQLEDAARCGGKSKRASIDNVALFVVGRKSIVYADALHDDVELESLIDREECVAQGIGELVHLIQRNFDDISSDEAIDWLGSVCLVNGSENDMNDDNVFVLKPGDDSYFELAVAGGVLFDSAFADAFDVQVRCWADAHVPCAVEFDVDAGVVRLTPDMRFVRLTGSLYRVFLWPTTTTTMRAASFCFRSATLPPIRLIGRLLSDTGATLRTHVFTLARSNSGDLLGELARALARRFDVSAARVGAMRTVDVDSVAHALSSVGSVARLGADALIEFRECDDERQCVLRGRQYSVGDGVVVHDDVEELSPQDYCRLHWVNPEAGYLAVAGKMSQEEENELLLSVVSAYCDEQEPLNHDSGQQLNRAEESNEASSSSSSSAPSGAEQSTTLSTTLLDEHEDLGMLTIPRDQLTPIWSGDAQQPRVFDVGDALDVDGVWQAWKRDGFFVCRLPDAVLARLAAVYDDAEVLFGLDESAQAGCLSRASAYLGLHRRPHFHKQLFSVRATAGGSAAHWPDDTVPTLRANAEALYDQLASLARSFATLALAKLDVSVGPDALFEGGFGGSRAYAPAAGGALSQSNMTMFRYDSAESVHTPYHSDVSLVTVLPKCRGAPGLHVFSWTQGWLDIERDMPDGCAVVIAGETLTAMSHNAMSPGIHDVSHIDTIRYSAPLQLLANSSAIIDASASASSFGGTVRQFRAIRAKHFVHAVSASRSSSNFPRNSLARR
jgi:isopenicillin N synthase-like dioxygenase